MRLQKVATAAGDDGAALSTVADHDVGNIHIYIYIYMYGCTCSVATVARVYY